MSASPPATRTRASGRIKKQRQMPDVRPSQRNEVVSAYWTDQDKQKLLFGLKRFGSNHPRLIQAHHLPHKSLLTVQTYIRNLKRLQNFSPCPRVNGRDIYQRPRDAPIENWIELIETRLFHTNVLGPARLPCDMMELICRYEKHPPMATPEAVDYGAIYGAMADLMRGEVPRDLNAATSHKMSGLMSRLLVYVRAHSQPLAAVKTAVAKYSIPRDFEQIDVPLDPAGNFNDFDFPLELFCPPDKCE
ncbi:hypothetical protein TCAL_14311 [Tigriopus californicus]|uniref:Myb-like domain-containing protein n=1 Tax=Tigriopus californicus TaxID=6832 RepID=A0A553NCU1_TIGCA|nr:uncharacterized protein LOC131888209 [Tigriopus californicus]TRY63264.1 hypothetical protein TCAL_14311 [Tigriopus californicus]